MGSNLPSYQLEIYKRIDEILFYKWDPIGVSDSAWARDEYRSYLPRTLSLVLECDSPEKIAGYLTMVTTESMGLTANRERDFEIANLLLEIKKSNDF